ncbi:MAG: hypothetical protein JWO38_6780 [Gemmataceae bacterium]|nr:hypothetical protein [Gemmataceae bacterium]
MNAIATAGEPEIDYPDSDGMPMAENTLQYEWIVTIKGNLDTVFAGNPDVFVAGDNLIYPVRGNNTIRQAPDVYVAFGRPKGHRGSYRVWEEGGVFPQVIFEILSPGNRLGEMKKKRQFYRRYGVEEYYVYDPDDGALEGWVRQNRSLEEIEDTNGFTSPRLGIRFDMSGPELVITGPDGERFLTFEQLADARKAERQRADAERQRAGQLERELERAKAILRAAGIDPDRPATG